MSKPLSNLIWHTSEQRSPEWFAARNGKVTGSVCSPLGSTTGKFTDGLSAGAWTLVYELAGDIIDPTEAERYERYQDYSMDRGQRLEPDALKAYKAATFNPGHLVGFVEAEGRLAGCSPDFMVSDTKGGEIKCLKMSKHIKWLKTLKVDNAHYRQIQWCLFVTGFETWDLVHYHPAAQKGMLHIQTYERDEKLIALFAEKLAIVERNICEIVKEMAYDATTINLPEGAQKEAA